MLLPANTGSGESDLVTARSAVRCTVVVAVPVLFPGVGSVVAEAPTALFVIVVPSGAPESTFTMIVNVAASPAAEVALANAIVPVPPAGTESVRDQPAGVVAETNVVLAGVASVSVTVCASEAPLLL